MNVFAIVLFLVFAICSESYAQTPLINCGPEKHGNQTTCEARGCLWNPAGVPSCIFPDGYGYEHDDTTRFDTLLGYILPLYRKDQPNMYNDTSPDVSNVYLSVEFWDESILRLKFYDPASIRYEVPIDIQQPSSKAINTAYHVTYTSYPQFGISVTRHSTNTVVFNTGLPGFVFSNQFLSISTTLPSKSVYGFGENSHEYLLHDLDWKVWAMFTLGNYPMESYNSYGVQPFYMTVEDDGNANGVLLLNSNAMEIELQPSPALTYRTIGGILDFYILLGPTPDRVVQQLTQIIGRPYMPPYWSLGFQLSKWDYGNSSELKSVIDNMRNAKIPYDVQYSDIDYMDGKKDFTLSQEEFKDLPEIIQDIHDYGQHYIVILDPGISNTDPDYLAYKQGVVDDIFIKYPNGTAVEGVVWPGNVNYPDFSHENIVKYWSEQCLYLYQNLSVKYDGLWIDMNEPASFITGSTSGCEQNQLNYPPYVPDVLGSYNGKLTVMTMCMDTVQSNGHLHYDVHSLYGYFMAKTTQATLLNNFPERRPFIVTRSQFPGSGRYAHHWLGDNDSTFKQLRNSVIGIQEFNMFGMPFVGADICGFNLNTYEELCIRWMQLGAFYSFSRNHNSKSSIPQDPPSLGERVVNASIKALTERYRLLPYLYTLLHEAHVTGSTVIRPLFFEFPADSQSWNISYQFLWGSGLLISPVVYEGEETVIAYYAKWYDYYTGNLTNGFESSYVELEATLNGNIPLHIRGGLIIPIQEPAVTTALSRQNPMGLLVAVDEQNQANGYLYWDDGISYQSDVKEQFNQLQFSFDKNILDVVILNNGFSMSTPLNTVVFYGLILNTKPSVFIDGNVLNSTKVEYNIETRILKLSDLNLPLPLNHQMIINPTM
ncbi:hypothetical protein CHUAL_007706 [Chamberlinius hualienensis]